MQLEVRTACINLPNVRLYLHAGGVEEAIFQSILTEFGSTSRRLWTLSLDKYIVFDASDGVLFCFDCHDNEESTAFFDWLSEA